MLSTLLGMPSKGATIEVSRRLRAACINSRLRLFHGGLLVDRHVRIAAELGERRRGLPLQACQIGLRRLQVAYRGIERGPGRGTSVKKMLLALVIGLRIVGRRLGLIDLFEA